MGQQHVSEQQPGEQTSLSLARVLGRPTLEGQDENRRIERLPGAHLEVKVGGALIMHFSALPQKHEGKVVGFEGYAYIIVQARMPQESLTRIVANPSLVAQHTASGVVFGFRSQVLNRVSSPAPILFLAFPDSVDRIVLRRDERVHVNVPGTIHGKYGEHEAMIQDLTPSGCQLSSKVDLKSPLREAQVGDRLILSCDLGHGQKLTTPLVLRRVSTEKGLLHLGAQFVDLTKETSLLVGGFVEGLRQFMSR